MKKKIIFIILIFCIISFGIIFKLNISKENTKWTLTQYGENQMPQMMCFTIEGNNNGLVIIDGGYEDSKKQVNTILSVAEKHNNTIDAWIITHLDSDHSGVFLNIYKNHPEITIKKVYTTNVPTIDKAKEKAPWEEEWKQFEEFCSLNLDNLTYLYENDKIEDIIGLKLNVLWAYSDWVYENCSNLLNNGSLVFKLYGNEESMLFCADTQDKKIETKLMENHKKDLKSNYLQVGHHGNNNFSQEFYKTVSPKVAFFAAPEDLVNNVFNVSWFTAGTIKQWLENDGVTVYLYNTTPNYITIL